MRPHNRLYLLILLTGTLLVGCRSYDRSVDPASPTRPASTASPQAKILIAPIPSLTSRPIQPVAPEITLVGKDPNPTSVPATVELPVVENEASVEVCSPLAGISLAELPDIISSRYDPPPPGKEDRHHGVDFSYYRRGSQASIQGVGVQAILPGVVAMALIDSFPYGNVVIIESSLTDLPASFPEKVSLGAGESLYTLFAHFDAAPEVQLGQAVSACQRLGAVGKSGNAGVAHLHLETRLGPAGNSFEMMGYYLAESTEQEKDNYLRWRISGEFRHFDPMELLNWQAIP